MIKRNDEGLSYFQSTKAEGQSSMQASPLTLADFEARFPDDAACLEFLKEQKYPAGMAFCAKCGRERRHHRVTGRRAYACDYCGSMISPAAGTIFAKSSTSLRTWFYALFRAATASEGLTARQLQRETSVTYKTAWRMMSRIRELLAACVEPAGGAKTGSSRGSDSLPDRPDVRLLFLLRGVPRPAADRTPGVAATPPPEPGVPDQSVKP
jgi:transposase-like protein